MAIKIQETITATLSATELTELLRDYFKKEGYKAMHISFRTKSDYSDPDCDRFGPDIVFDKVTATLERIS